MNIIKEGRMETILCEECEKDISKRFQLTHSRVCVECKESLGDDFKWKMKKVGRDDEPTIAKNEKDWLLLKKQKVLRDI